MALVHSLELAHLPNVAVHVALFDQVANAADLRRHLLDGNPDYEYAFLDVTTILSTTHVLAAVFRAVNDALHNRLRSRNVHSEVVFCLSPNNNIAESFRRFGIQDSTRALLAIKITSTTPSPPPPSTTPSPSPSLPAQTISSHLTANVHGTPLPFTDAAIAPFTDLPRVRKIYKLDAAAPSARGRNPKKGQAAPPPLPVNGVGGEGKGDERAEMEASVLGMMALRGS
ncbi:kinase binding protein CGI-121-domain-containing protein [Phyllosticta citrichinensis]|uniref:EKC/KEOPS complex subunit CGI121 n=1 Tax=Phyllosticta citrichinensis TaxID=1130410 RepID=A0ABR1XU80_9PEZI